MPDIADENASLEDSRTTMLDTSECSTSESKADRSNIIATRYWVAGAALTITGVRLLRADPMFYGYPNWDEGYDHKVDLLMAETGISCNDPLCNPRHPSAGAL